jgi:hypothetical protein
MFKKRNKNNNKNIKPDEPTQPIIPIDYTRYTFDELHYAEKRKFILQELIFQELKCSFTFTE